ncbi:E3 ubiquitin-protein ligase NEURL1 [Lamellibrachia satsuma]|nr:E3 ubiquitin-protein ligase NEURL1 [Lamellibrachia satsuma]
MSVHPLLFHETRGLHVQLSADKRRATRVESFGNGICFSNRPVAINERVYIKVCDASADWSGAFRFGFTSCNPAKIKSAKLPTYACPDLTNKPGYWAKAPPEKFAEKDTVLFFYVRRGGDVMYGVKGKENGLFFSGVSTSSPIWALIDIYGNTISVVFVGLCDLGSNAMSVNPLLFHETRGLHVQLSADKRRATRVESFGNGICFSNRPVAINERVYIKFSDVSTSWSGVVRFGVTSCNPATINSAKLPRYACPDLTNKPDFWAKALPERFAEKDTVVFFYVTRGGNVMYGVNCEENGLFFSGVSTSSPIWVLIDIYGNTISLEFVGETSHVRDSAHVRDSSHLRDSSSPSPSGFRAGGDNTVSKRCIYWEVCHRFFRTLEIQEVFVNSKFNICYCSECHSWRKDEDYYTRGQPAKTYSVPVGWCRIGLHAPVQAKAHKSFDTWHRAFHGTNAEYVAPILEVGHLLVPGDVALGGKRIGEKSGHFNDEYKPEGFETRQVFLSPSIRYAGRDTYAKPSSYKDAHTKKTYTSRVALQVLVKPGCYKVGAQTVGSKRPIDPTFSNEELEWSTVQRGSIIIYGLLIHLEKS